MVKEKKNHKNGQISMIRFKFKLVHHCCLTMDGVCLCDYMVIMIVAVVF